MSKVMNIIIFLVGIFILIMNYWVSPTFYDMKPEKWLTFVAIILCLIPFNYLLRIKK
ncbi:hypothetical protein [Clostridium estertheticum]|uniref:hypothetical protein n=1 Tax=Clostridium estertheticum TaxID=238834 RepID=UPI001CF1C943|nr:hypothetical protein [Clostridium estertheticum]MCB2342773.1 hypothetical protein [Clostridium estertheticum]